MDAYGVTKVEWNTLLSSSDAVLLHCDLSGETSGLIDASALGRMKPTALLINAARGALVDSRSLHDALHGGSIGGAGLDVFHPENPHDDPWYAKVVQLPNVVVSSHRAFLSAEALRSSRRRTAEAIFDVLTTGRCPRVGVVTAPGDRRALCDN